jgi:YegS/Rv2252/BmrU family lipid kinase
VFFLKSVQLIYNPAAGKYRSVQYIDKIIESFQSQGYTVNIHRSSRKGDMGAFLNKFNSKNCEAIIASGGDGSINEVVNGMVNNNIDIPLGIIPSGTANDFAYYLGLPSDIDECLDVFSKWDIEDIDIGKANDKCFINVCGAGLFTNGSLEFDPELKNTLGKLAYYITGLGQIPKFKPFPLRITTPKMSIQEDFYFFLAFNGISAGGFKAIAKFSKADDGLIDFIGVKAAGLHEIPGIFLKILAGEHFNDKNILYLQEKHMKIECLVDNKIFKTSDLDGEPGPELPLDISILDRKLRVFTNRKK